MSTPAPRLTVCHGARATEEALLAQVDELTEAARVEPALLTRPVRLVVPSRSLRLHLSTRLVARQSRAVAGVLVQTHWAVALEVLERSGERAPKGRLLFELLPRRLAVLEQSLLDPLDGLEDGYGAVVASIKDLLDANLEPAHEEGLIDLLAEMDRRAATPAEVRRAEALVRVAARTRRLAGKLGLGHPSLLLDRAATLLRERPEELLPSRAVLVHGFADATGRVTDLLEALQAAHGARVFLDRPADPASPPGRKPIFAGAPPVPGTSRDERAFGAAFVERLVLAAAPEELSAPAAATDVALEAFCAHGAEAEVREAALRVRALLDDGAAPGSIALVARDLSPYRLPVRRWLDRLGVPFSGGGEAGSVTPEGRRAAALLDLLARRGETPGDRFLSALAWLPRLADLRLALYALGAGRLKDVAQIEVDEVAPEGFYALPLRQGLVGAARDEGAAEAGEAEGDGDGDEAIRPVHPRRRTISRETLAQVVDRAWAVLERFERWPREAPLADHLDALERLVTNGLGWAPGDERIAPFTKAAARLRAEAPAELAVSYEELVRLLARAAEPHGHSPLGGDGGGVAVLSVTEARARTFDHLFLLGLERDLFPRPVREDPLLPDALRLRLRALLPDLPVKGTGHDEERFLFAQLLSAAPRVTLSWRRQDESGRERPLSPLVERLRQVRTLEVAKAPSVWSPRPARPADAIWRPAYEHATIAALHAPRGEARERVRGLLPRAVAEAAEELGEPGAVFGLDPGVVAAARTRALDELEPDLATPAGRARDAALGPFFGFLGPVQGEDPRAGRLSVTMLERLAGCPWQVVLERLLGVEPTPDPLTLPGLDPRLVGNAVHEVLEAVARRALPKPPRAPGTDAAGEPPDLSRLLADGSPVPVPWPDEEELAEIAREAAWRVLAREGLFLPGLARVLARACRPYLEAAREVDWLEPPAPSVLGVEVPATLLVADAAGGERPVSFRADRVDGAPMLGRALLTDYKTGKPLSAAKTESTRRKHLVEQVRQGTRLQAVAYALAAGPGGRGRYLFLKPETEHRSFTVAADDAEAVGAFREAVRRVLEAWDAGSFFPRLVDVDGRKRPARCDWCAVHEACLQGDSGARRRLFEWTDRRRGEGGGGDGREAAALLAAWRLPAAPEERA